MLSTTKGIEIKLHMLAAMLDKLHNLYPQFADKVTWEQAHILLADFCVPEEFRGTERQYLPDEYYISRIAYEFKLDYMTILEAFYAYNYDKLHSSKLKESQSQ